MKDEENPSLDPPSEDVTGLLHRWGQAGDRAALDALIPLVTEELRCIAGRLFAHERAGHTLQPTALVSEAYVRLIGRREGQWKDRLHFFSFAAREMRRVLVDHARKSHAVKRGQGFEIVPLDVNDEPIEAGTQAVDLLALDLALEKLARFDGRQARLLELRYFAGLKVEEIAEVEGLSRATVFRDLSMARAWVKRELS